MGSRMMFARETPAVCQRPVWIYFLRLALAQPFFLGAEGRPIPVRAGARPAAAFFAGADGFFAAVGGCSPRCGRIRQPLP